MSQVSKHRRSKDVKVARVMNQGQGEGRNNFKVKEQDSGKIKVTYPSWMIQLALSEL